MIAALFVWRCVPETKGKSLEDGIKPDVYVNMDKILEEGIEQGDIESQKKDPLIEKAFEILSE